MTLYGVRQETLEAYVKEERRKVWEAAANIAEEAMVSEYTDQDADQGYNQACKDIARRIRQHAKETYEDPTA